MDTANAALMTDFEHYQAVVQHQQSASKVLTDIMRRITEESGSSEHLADLVKAAQSELAGATASLPPLLRLIPADERTSPASKLIAARTFSIPELFERILINLNLSGLLRAQQVSHQFFDNIQSSPNLQQCMGLAPDTKHGFRLTHKNITPAFWLMTEATEHAYRSVGGDNISMRASFHGGHSLPHLGERVRAVLICQPPLKIMNAYTECCNDFYRAITAPPTKVLHSDTGITIGDLIEAVQTLQLEHELCPHAEQFDHDSDGKVVVSIRFEGTVSVPESDRTLLEKREVLEAAAKKQEKQKILRARLLPYVAAKVAGKVHL